MMVKENQGDRLKSDQFRLEHKVGRHQEELKKKKKKVKGIDYLIC